MDYSCHNPFDSVAQLVEQRTFNQWVAGSSPARVILELEMSSKNIKGCTYDKILEIDT